MERRLILNSVKKTSSNLEFFERELNFPTFPIRVTVELTNHCNLYCRMCPRRFMKGPKGYMTVPLFQKIINELAEYAPLTLVPFFRGESLLHPEFISMIRFAKEQKLSPIQLATNGTLLTKEIAQQLLDSELDFISFSVDSVDSESYHQIRGENSFEKVLLHIETLLEMKQEHGSKHPEIQVSMVKSAWNEEKVQSFLDRWQGRVDRIRVYEEHSKNGNFGSLGSPTGEIVTHDRRPCLKPFQEMVIYWNGEVALCNHDWDRKDHIGNLNEMSILSVWQDEKYRNIRQSHLDGSVASESVCLHCDHWRSGYGPDNILGELYE